MSQACTTLGPVAARQRGDCMDTDVIPLGERALRSVLDHVIAVGDEAETSYLEVKSTLDLGSSEGVAKVAKFLLGVSNRLPHDAARHFRGYAVLLIGAEKGHVDGIARGTEAHELEDRLRRYLGPQFPLFELERIAVSPDREVLFVIAQPPQDGQPVFPCHKDYQGAKGQDRLDNGAIYVRGTSNTRSARAGEVLALVERARDAGKPPISLGVEITGQISRVDQVDEMLHALYDFEEEQFTNPKPASRENSPAPIMPSVYGRSRSLSPRDRAVRLEKWQRERESHVITGRAHFLGAALPGMGIRVFSRNRFLSKPQLIVTFHDCEAFPWRDAEDADYDKLVEPIAPQTKPFGIDPAQFATIRHRDYPVTWRNNDHDAEVILTPESFRPNVPWSSADNDYVVLARNPQATAVNVTWLLTEQGSDTPTTGKLEVTPGAASNAFDLLKRLLSSSA